jgi:hypothetical protein
MAEAIEGFTHRENPDGTFDSICHRCFRTVAKEDSEDSLRTAEAVHRCSSNNREPSEDDLDWLIEFPMS